MAKKAIRVKTGVKVVKKSNAPVKPKFRAKAPGMLTEKVAFVVNSKKK